MKLYLHEDLSSVLASLAEPELTPGGRIVLSQLTQKEALKCMEACKMSFDARSVVSALSFLFKCKRYLKTGQCLPSFEEDMKDCQSVAKEALKVAKMLQPEPSAVLCESDIVHFAILLPECEGLAVVSISPAGYEVTHAEGVLIVEKEAGRLVFGCVMRRAAKPGAPAKGNGAEEYLKKIATLMTAQQR